MKRVISTVILFLFVTICYAQNICAISRHVKKNYELLVKKPELVKGGNDSCVLNIVDSLSYYSTKEDTTALYILNKLWVVSDGYLSEGIMEATSKLYYTNAVFLTRWLFSHPKANLKARLTEGLSMNVSVHKDKELTRIKSIAKNAKTRLSKNEAEFLDSLIKKIDPRMWE